MVPNAIGDLRDANATHAYFTARRFSDWKTGEIGAALPVIAAAAGWSLPTLRRAFTALRSAGWLDLRGPQGKERWWIVPPSASMTVIKDDATVINLDHPPVIKVDHAPATTVITADTLITVDQPPATVIKADTVRSEPARQDAEKPASAQYDQGDLLAMGDGGSSTSSPTSCPCDGSVIDQIRTKDKDPIPIPADSEKPTTQLVLVGGEDRARRKAKASADDDAIERVIVAFEVARGIGDHVRTPALRNQIREAIHAAGPEKCIAAVRGIWQDEYWAAQGPTIGTALRSADNIERFAAMAPQPQRYPMVEFLARWSAAREDGGQRFRTAPRRPAKVTMPHGLAAPQECEVDGIVCPVFTDALVKILAFHLASDHWAAKIVLASETEPEPRARVREDIAAARANFHKQVARAKRDAELMTDVQLDDDETLGAMA